jgi:2-haloacid dehalogenase
MINRRRILVFDVNETMLDVDALTPHFIEGFGAGDTVREWFTTLLHYSTVATLAGPYAQFGAIADAALTMLAESRRVSLTPELRQRIGAGLRSLPAHPDVRPALDALRRHGFRLVTLTNSAPSAVAQQLANAGLADCFERSFSVDDVQRFKPAPEPYRQVATELGVAVGDLRLVAAHAWDVVGALRAGCAAAFVARPGKVLYPLGPRPDIVAPDCLEAARAIIEVDRES